MSLVSKIYILIVLSTGQCLWIYQLINPQVRISFGVHLSRRSSAFGLFVPAPLFPTRPERRGGGGSSVGVSFSVRFPEKFS
jgi:hypothetical protein